MTSQSYRVQVMTGSGFTFTDVEAETGDEAAVLAHKKFPGSKVAHVEPTPRNTMPAGKVSRPKLTAAPGEAMVEIDSLGPDAKVVA